FVHACATASGESTPSTSLAGSAVGPAVGKDIAGVSSAACDDEAPAGCRGALLSTRSTRTAPSAPRAMRPSARSPRKSPHPTVPDNERGRGGSLMCVSWTLMSLLASPGHRAHRTLHVNH